MESHVVYGENGVEGHEDNWLKQVAVQSDPAAELITGEVNQVHMGEDRIVNTEVLLNDTTVEQFEFQTPRLGTDLVCCTVNHGEAISQGFGECEEGVSNKTVTQVYGTGGGRVTDGNGFVGNIILREHDHLDQQGDNILGGVIWGLVPRSPSPIQIDIGPRDLDKPCMGRARKCGPQVGRKEGKRVSDGPKFVGTGRAAGRRVITFSPACWPEAQPVMRARRRQP
ncbi:uncharacterized protein DS421_5g142930 [Arachis hypogaea]|nr:uncharacterized protein DS421_5g142930 [Arachis hypogaea]